MDKKIKAFFIFLQFFIYSLFDLAFPKVVGYGIWSDHKLHIYIYIT